MGSPIDVVRAFIDAFIAAWPTADADRLRPFFAEHAVYVNGPLEAVQGRRAIGDTLAGFMAMGGEVAVDLLHVLADDSTVMTERVDHFVVDGRRLSLPVMGVFEISDGEITAWRDYFDLSQFPAS